MNFLASAYAQPLRTNMDIVNDLISLSTAKIDSALGGNLSAVYLDFVSPPQYQFLKNSLVDALTKRGVKLLAEPAQSSGKISYSLSNVQVIYGESFRTGFLGDAWMPREVSIKGSFYLTDVKGVNSPVGFNPVNRDSVLYDAVKEIENDAVPFSKGNVPSEPFPSSLLEPVIAVGALIVAVVLLFTVRSK